LDEVSSCSQLFISYFELIFLSDKIKKRRYSLCYIKDFLWNMMKKESKITMN